MSQRLSIFDGSLQIDELQADVPTVIEAGTSVLDAVHVLGCSGMRPLLIREPDGRFAGVVTQQDLMSFITQQGFENQDERLSQPVQNLLLARFLSTRQTGHATHLPSDSHQTLKCQSIMEDGRLAGVMTDDDVLLSWRLIQPLVEAATIDAVTGLANRATFTRRLAEEWDRSRRTGHPMGIILIDIDWFKEINDQCGHLAGDAVLAGIGASLKRALRSYDMVSRYGGDEFAAICCDCDPDAMDAPIYRLQSRVRRLIRPNGLRRGELSLSIGTAIVTGGFHELNPDRVLKAADDCLYKAKANGRDQAFRITINGSHFSEPEVLPHDGLLNRS